jgi:hypothetical protein
MKHFLILAVLLTAKTVLADAIVANNKQTRTIACAKDGVVLIAGNDNTIKLTGQCKLVRIPGNNNKVTADGTAVIAADGNDNVIIVIATDAISLNGSHNRVQWSKTISGDEEPDVSSWGDDNEVKKK